MERWREAIVVRHPNRERVGNNDKQCCVIVFCDQRGNTLRAAPTLLDQTDDWGRAPVRVVHVSLDTEYKVDYFLLQF